MQQLNTQTDGKKMLKHCKSHKCGKCSSCKMEAKMLSEVLFGGKSKKKKPLYKPVVSSANKTCSCGSGCKCMVGAKCTCTRACKCVKCKNKQQNSYVVKKLKMLLRSVGLMSKKK